MSALTKIRDSFRPFYEQLLSLKVIAFVIAKINSQMALISYPFYITYLFRFRSTVILIIKGSTIKNSIPIYKRVTTDNDDNQKVVEERADVF